MKKVLTTIIILFIICIFSVFVLSRRDKDEDNLKEVTLADTTLTSRNIV